MAEFPIPSRMHDLTGRKVNRLTVTGWAFQKNGVWHWVCDCECGGSRAVQHSVLVSKNVRSCGCDTPERYKKLNKAGVKARTTHGMSNTKEHDAWLNMLERCDPNFHQVKDYHDRGITVCEEWKNDPKAFLDYMGPIPEPGMSLERIDNDKGYFAGNVEWATRKKQQRNRRNNLMLTIGDKKQCLLDWANELGLCYESMRRFYHKVEGDAHAIITHFNIQYPPKL